MLTSRRRPRTAAVVHQPPSGVTLLPSSRWSPPPLRRIVLVATLAALATMITSYVQAMLRPSSTSLGVRSVEWVRSNVSAWLVDEIERLYYSWQAPTPGGPALKALPRVGVSVSAGAGPHPRLGYRPPRVRLRVHPALRGEGLWRSTGRRVAGAPAVLVTTFRPDPVYPRMVAGVAWIDRTRARAMLYPGRYEPPGNGTRGAMEVPAGLRRGLLATFNSGFRLEDGPGGFFADGALWSPLKPGLGTIVGRADGTADVISWRGGPRPGPGIVFARQNLPLIVEDGKPNPDLSDGPQWGATLGNAIRVWRSGLGVDRHGNLVYAAADQQTVGSLARILMDVGAVRAVELDINYEWVSFISYARSGGRDPTKLLFAIDHGGTRYLVPDDRDFFAVYARAARGRPGRRRP